SPNTEVNINTYYSFIPQAQDLDDDSLTFIVTNLPNWASFNTDSGEISGTPTLEALHEDIVISVSDSTDSTSLNAFYIDVRLPDPLAVTIKWQAPSQDINDEALGPIQAYKVFYGSVQGSYDQSVTINDGSATDFVINNLVPGDYFFSMVVITENGMESAMSNELYFQVEQ
ncbi:MAG: putative Ig domain-containing protein, partial [Colwellia sp.]